MRWLVYALLLAVGMAAGVWLDGCSGGVEAVDERVDTVRVTDTVVVRAPVAVNERVVGRWPLPGPPREGGCNSAGADTARQSPTPALPEANSASADTTRQRVSLSLQSGHGGQYVEVLQRHYVDSTYEAWVSGPIDPRLDSIRVFAERSVVTRTVSVTAVPKRWHFGVSAGLGLTPKGAQPYIGVGISYSILSW